MNTHVFILNIIINFIEAIIIYVFKSKNTEFEIIVPFRFANAEINYNFEYQEHYCILLLKTVTQERIIILNNK